MANHSFPLQALGVLRRLLVQINRCDPIDSHGHEFILNASYLAARQFLEEQVADAGYRLWDCAECGQAGVVSPTGKISETEKVVWADHKLVSKGCRASQASYVKEHHRWDLSVPPEAQEAPSKKR